MIKKYDIKIWGSYSFSKLDLGRLESFEISFGETSQNHLLGIVKNSTKIHRNKSWHWWCMTFGQLEYYRIQILVQNLVFQRKNENTSTKRLSIWRRVRQGITEGFCSTSWQPLCTIWHWKHFNLVIGKSKNFFTQN